MKKLELRIVAMGSESGPPQFVDMVIIPCTNGDLGVLPGRAPCTMVVGKGNVRLLNEGEETRIPVVGGIASVAGDVVTILANE